MTHAEAVRAEAADAERAAPAEIAAEDRRGRRASWVALGVVALGIAIAFVRLGPWYEAERYERLRDLASRANRFAIERAIGAAPRQSGRLVLLASVDALGGGAWASRVEGTRTLDSLAAHGRRLALADAPGQATLALALARGAEARTVAVSGRTGDLDASALTSVFDEVDTDWPPVTGYLDEAPASWVTVRAIRALENAGPGDAFVWVRYADLLPPIVRESRFRVPRALNERVAVEHYLGRLLAYARATRGAGEIVVIATDDTARSVLVVGMDVPGDVATAEELAAALAPPERRRVSG